MVREKRIIGIFGLFVGGFLCCILGMMAAFFHGDELQQAAAAQSSYQLAISRSRGNFYDCMGVKLTGRSEEALAAVAPTIEAAARMNQLTTGEYRETVGKALKSGTPFLAKVPVGTENSSGIDVFSVANRYEDMQLASNLIGYLDGKGHGVAGLEKAFDDVLFQEGLLKVTYSVDAVNRVMDGTEREVTDTREENNQGVVLTIDRRIQKIVEEACQETISSGAVIVSEVATGEIKAAVSLPSLHPDDIAADLEAENSPLLNKAFSEYSVGSVFKLVSAAAALESGINPDYGYYCDGSIEVEGQEFKCFDGIAHGAVTMESAIAKSCNGYFVHLMQQVEPEKFLEMAKAFGFGQETTFAPEYASASGALPSVKSLLVKRALANFSFGQGELIATPVQVSAMTSVVASGGYYRDLSLVKGIVDTETGVYQYQQPGGEKKRVISADTAEKLRVFMQKAVEEGTATSGKPQKTNAGAKTGTAQTGQMKGGEEVVQLWYTGYFPTDVPKYVITVLRANQTGNSRECGEVFQKIADEMTAQGF